MALVCTTSAFVIKSIQESSTSADPRASSRASLLAAPPTASRLLASSHLEGPNRRPIGVLGLGLLTLRPFLSFPYSPNIGKLNSRKSGKLAALRRMSSPSLGSGGRLFAYDGLVFHNSARLSLRDGLDASLAV